MAEKVVPLGAVEVGRFGLGATGGAAFALAIFLSDVVLLEIAAGLEDTGLPAAALLCCGLETAFNLVAAGCDRRPR